MNGGPIAGRSPLEPYYNPYGQEGEEISSTYEGRHVMVMEENLIHPDNTDANGDDFVRKGDPVCFFDGVGVALKTATAVTEVVPIDTEGIWRLMVINTSDLFGPVYVGQTLFIDWWDGTITEDPTVGSVFGYALQSIDELVDGGGDPLPNPAIIAVKVHWGGPWWFWWMFGPWIP
jgi:hypothetical protein